MQNRDYTFKILLLLLVIGVWGLLASPFIGTYALHKPGGADQPAAATAPQTERQYSVWVYNDKSAKIEIGGDGYPSVSGIELVKVLEATPRLGWKVHSVLYNPKSGGFVVIVEK
ncbi:MAG TPA: hypothetical protein VFV58_30725 [Blastocatellia bacterium]|jgi:hypothetical protein|nr:hypothetical protein [Blastocatellia bacterium]